MYLNPSKYTLIMDPENLLKQLKILDSNIEIHDSLKELSKERVQSFIDRRTRDIDADCLDDDLEWLRNLNLLSFLSFAIDKKEEAVQYNDKALKIDGRSINALTCRAYYYFKWDDFYESEKQYQVLKSTLPNKEAILIAKAELAYAYTKIGFSHFQKATEKFEEVLSDCGDVPDRYVCSWKFSCALALRRLSHLGNAPCKCSLDDPETYLQKAEQLYKDIIAMKEDNIQRYKARACVDLGLEIYLRRDKQSTNAEYEHTYSYNHIVQALSLEPEDEFVLSRSGKYFRLIGNHEYAINLLRKAVAIKETSFSYHHLALSLRDLKQNAHMVGSNASTRQDVTKSLTEEHFRKLIKSPQHLRYIPPEETEEIFQYLDKAVALNNNIAALYDKGLVLRSSKQYTEAIDVFKTIVHEHSSSNLQLADAYEQAAMCLLEEAEIDSTKKDKNECNAKIFLRKSIEFSYELISRIPDLRESWGSKSVLRSLLLSKERTKETLQELAQLYTKDRNWYPKAKVIFEKLIQLGENDEEKQEVLVDLFDASVSNENYDDAIIAMYEILPDGYERIDTESCVRALIKGGIASWQNNDEMIAKKRLKEALNIKELGRMISEEVPEIKIQHDIFVLATDNSEEMARPVSQLLRKFGPNVTLNSDDAMPGHMITKVITKAIESSQYIVVFLAAEEKDKDVSYMQMMFTDNSRKTTMTISESDRAAKDSIYCRLPSVPYRSDIFSNIDCITEEQVSWVEQFLFTLTGANPSMST